MAHDCAEKPKNKPYGRRLSVSPSFKVQRKLTAVHFVLDLVFYLEKTCERSHAAKGLTKSVDHYNAMNTPK